MTGSLFLQPQYIFPPLVHSLSVLNPSWRKEYSPISSLSRLHQQIGILFPGGTVTGLLCNLWLDKAGFSLICLGDPGGTNEAKLGWHIWSASGSVLPCGIWNMILKELCLPSLGLSFHDGNWASRILWALTSHTMPHGVCPQVTVFAGVWSGWLTIIWIYWIFFSKSSACVYSHNLHKNPLS